MNEEIYIKGFNSGYIMAEHKPELLDVVTKNTPNKNEYIEGMKDGKEQLEIEKIEEQVKDIEDLRSRSSSRDNGLERE